jgi:two-component system, chemotaxis family, response regulator Rcp1
MIDGLRKAHILVIEDNPADVVLLRFALESAGVDCALTVLDDGGEALEFIERKESVTGMEVPDLVVLDLNLPKTDGIEILEAMRNTVAFADIPVAVLSSSSSPRERARMEGFRVARYMTKPPDLEEFMQIGLIVRDLLNDIAARSG